MSAHWFCNISDFEQANVKEQNWPIKCQCCPHTESSQLICYAKQLTVFYARTTLAFNGLIYLGILLEAYSEPCQTSKMEHFAKIVNGFQPLEEVKNS